ncbi:MAG: hypothetical protein MUP15_10200 [Dehalococcoidia bacterium]|nr:hypothetical protein [Dehalococcoidia bacterium]
MNRPIEGRVARILNIREVAINVGATQGVEEGMVFAILSKEPLVIIDPDSGQQLGSEDRVKVRVKATEVYERYSVCRTFEVVPGFNPLEAIATAGALLATPPRVKTLKVESSDLPEPLAEDASYVKTGDRVRQIPEVGKEEQ